MKTKILSRDLIPDDQVPVLLKTSGTRRTKTTNLLKKLLIP